MLDKVRRIVQTQAFWIKYRPASTRVHKGKRPMIHVIITIDGLDRNRGGRGSLEEGNIIIDSVPCILHAKFEQ